MTTELPTELTPGNLFSWQRSLETRLERELTNEAGTVLSSMKAEALSLSLTAAFARKAWSDAVDRTLATLELTSPECAELRDVLEETNLGEEAYLSAMGVMARRLSGETKQLTLALDEALGLDTPSLVAAGASGWRSKLLKPAQRVGHVWKTRLKRQVRTGFTGLTGRLVIADMRRRGMTHKKWVTRHDPIVRDTHAAADGQVQPIDLPFTVGIEHLQHPGERGKELSETANCRCVLVPAPTPGLR